jgi:anti-sigma regulatory factor (Ser/Thr protein kinase)
MVTAVPSISLPCRFTGATLSTFVDAIDAKCPDGWPPEIEIDFANLGWIEPSGVVFLSNLIHWVHEKGTKVRLANVQRNVPAMRYLDDSEFFKQHCGALVWPTSKPRVTTQPLIRIAHSHSHAWLDSTLVPWLASRTQKTKASFYMLKSCLSELFNNIQDHTRFDIGSIFVQHYPQIGKGELKICIADFGLGIPEKVRETVPNLSDSDAVLQAVQEGFTSKSTPGNAGLGLDSLLKCVVGTNGGTVIFYTLNAIVTFSQDAEGKISHYCHKEVGFCPGTTIEINLRTDMIEELPDESEDLEW